MYDTFGFPIDLTLLMCEEKGFAVDEEGYKKEMEEAKKRSKESSTFKDGAVIEMTADQVDQLKNKKAVPPTDDSFKYTWTSTGSGDALPATLKAVMDAKKVFHDASVDGLQGLVLSCSAFYAEAGGQVADLGTISAGDATFTVHDVKKFGPYVLHIGECTSGTFTVGQEVSQQVDYVRRANIAKNHTSTHMLNLALRDALGQNCDQRGSLNDDEKLRFDFAYGKPLTEAELEATQAGVNQQIQDGLLVHCQEASLELAREIGPLRAVFGEQYPDPVRVVAIGGTSVQDMLEAPKDDKWKPFSVEFCGGTHIANAKEAEHFALISEEGLGRGVRRVVGATGAKAKEAFEKAAELSARLEAAAKLQGGELTAEANELTKLVEVATVPAVDKKKLMAGVTGLKKKLVDAQKGDAAAAGAAAKAEAEAWAASATGDYVVGLLQVGADNKVVEEAVKVLTTSVPEKAVLVLGKGKTANALAVVPPGLASKIDAKEWVNAALAPCGGKGGGKSARAQGAARDPSSIEKAEVAAKEYAAGKL